MLAKEEIALVLERFKPPICIDEIRYAPEFFPYIKMAVDKSDDKGTFLGIAVYLGLDHAVTQYLRDQNEHSTSSSSWGFILRFLAFWQPGNQLEWVATNTCANAN